MFGPQIIQQAQLVRRFAFEAFEDVRRFFFAKHGVIKLIKWVSLHSSKG